MEPGCLCLGWGRCGVTTQAKAGGGQGNLGVQSGNAKKKKSLGDLRCIGGMYYSLLVWEREKEFSLGYVQTNQPKGPVCRVNGTREGSPAGSGAASMGSPSARGDTCAEHRALLGD